MKKSTEGFTLIELVVGIFCATLITGAAMSLMLMGLRNTQSLTVANTNLQNARIILTMVEKLASEGAIQKIVVNGDPDDDSGEHDWSLLTAGAPATDVLHYSHENETIYGAGNSVLMEGVTKSHVSVESADLGGSLVNFYIEVDGDLLQTSVYCRHSELDESTVSSDSGSSNIIFAGPSFSGTTNDEPTNIDKDTVSNNILTLDPNTNVTGRTLLVKALLEQYGSHGEIYNSDSDYPEYFCNWYNKNWDPETTAWCACFVSWGLEQVGSSYLDYIPRFAWVQSGWDDLFDRGNCYGSATTPTPGDLIFFEWQNGNGQLDHIGVVLYVSNGYVYTIEGNSNAKEAADGWVAVQRYPLDSKYIQGYAALDWTA